MQNKQQSGKQRSRAFFSAQLWLTINLCTNEQHDQTNMRWRLKHMHSYASVFATSVYRWAGDLIRDSIDYNTAVS